MHITVYSVSGAPRPWRVLLGLAFKGIDYDIHTLQASKGEHKAPEYLKLNPRGTVPTVVADDLVIRDSLGALVWLDRAFPTTPLFGDTANAAANIWQIATESSDYLRGATNDALFPLLVQGKPFPAPDTEAGAATSAAIGKLKSECQRLEDLLDGQPYLAGEKPSAADAVSFPDVRLIERAVDTRFTDMDAYGMTDLAGQFPNLDAWKTRISRLPGYDKTTPSHW
ncbi:MAG: glutathione S-transferase family protein [Pseudomonadota bacterium]